VAEGAISLNGERLEAGDAAAITGPEDLALGAESASQVLLFDLA
jgi:redox-sensitive bicupin YhaK (pirin superfamily)